ncbi:hypothetical protein [Roseateles sp.]|uniref:hypothetical protein n=1 Tax=Roseateles sp. TaxID=1971397 RepID=UPI003BA8121B
MKFHSIALAAAACAAAPAFAAPAVNVDAPSTVRLYTSGATALRAAIAGVILKDVCGGTATNASTTLYNVVESGTSFKFNGNFWAITCKVDAVGGAKIGLPANTNIAFFNSGAGGSAQGVFPVYFEDQRPFVETSNLANCKGATASDPAFANVTDRAYFGCPSTRSAVPNLGISDVEPKLFKGINVPKDPLDADDDVYPADGLSDGQLAELTVMPVIQTVFALAVNANLYNDMFAKQGLATKYSTAGVLCTTASTDESCTPSVGLAEARSIFAGTETNWRLLSNNAALVGSQVNVCRRVDGSGTQAAANLQLFGFPCNANSGSPADYSFADSAAAEAMSASKATTVSGKSIANYLIDNMGGNAGNGPMPTGTTFVFEGPGTGDVTACLTAANKAGGYAVGHVSKENPATATWKHVRLEGAVADGAFAKQGRYDYLVESTIQYKTAASRTAEQQAFIDGFTAQIAKPDALAKLSSNNQAGVLALPGSYAGDFGVGSVNEIKFGSRVTRNGNSCNPLAAVK